MDQLKKGLESGTVLIQFEVRGHKGHVLGLWGSHSSPVSPWAARMLLSDPSLQAACARHGNTAGDSEHRAAERAQNTGNGTTAWC